MLEKVNLHLESFRPSIMVPGLRSFRILSSDLRGREEMVEKQVRILLTNLMAMPICSVGRSEARLQRQIFRSRFKVRWARVSRSRCLTHPPRESPEPLRRINLLLLPEMLHPKTKRKAGTTSLHPRRTNFSWMIPMTFRTRWPRHSRESISKPDRNRREHLRQPTKAVALSVSQRTRMDPHLVRILT